MRITRMSAPMRTVLAGLAALAVAELAVWVLWPGGRILSPADVPASSEFDPAELRRIADFHDPQRLLGLGSLALELALLAVLALWRPAALRRALRFPLGRPVVGSALVAAGISLLIALATLPPALIGHDRARDVGLSTRPLGPWFADWAQGTAIGLGFAAVGGVLAVLMIRRLGRRFWLGGTALVIVYALVTTWLGPVVLAPLFNDFTPLERGPVRRQVVELGERAGVDIGQVYVVDASRRSTGLNAYVNGLGSSKRVVIYDTALKDLDRRELGSLIAHELGHVKGNDVWRGIAFAIIVTPLGVLFVQLLAFGLTERRGGVAGTPAVIPALALAVTLAALLLNVPGNQLSRAVESRADNFALELTHDPKALIALQRQLTIANFGDPNPPRALQFLFGTHPATMQRIGTAVAYEERDHPGTTAPRRSPGGS